MFSFKNLMLSLALSAITAMGAFAQTGPASGGGNAGTNTTTTSVNPSPAGGTLASVDVLHATLQKLGSNVQNLSGPQGWTTYLVEVQKGDTIYPIGLQMNKGVIFLMVNLGTVGDLSNASPGLLEQVVALGGPIGPSYLRFANGANGTKVLQLAHRIDRNITPERLAEAIKEFLGDIKASEKVWSQLVQR